MFVELNGAKLYYKTVGSGQPMMFLHGGLGFDHTVYLESFKAFEDQAELIYYDHRGNGRSERTETMEGITHETLVADADALRAYLGHEKVILVGHSYGGFLAQEYAVRYQDTLKGLILIDTAPVIDYMDVIQANAAARGTPEQLDGVGQAFGRPMVDDADFQAIWETVSPLYFKEYDPAKAAKANSQIIYSAAAWNYANGVLLPAFNVLEQLKDVQTPTLVISGIDDWITPLKQGAERIHNALPNSELVVFENSGHWPFIEENEKFVEVVSDWIAKL